MDLSNPQVAAAIGKDFTSQFSQQDIQNNKGISLLSYLGILVLVPIFVAKDSAYARFHANQGLLLCILSIVISIMMAIITTIGYFIHIAVGIILSIVTFVVSLALLALAVYGIINAVTGKAKELPLIGRFRILK